MLKKLIVWNSPVLAAFLFVMMTSAVLAFPASIPADTSLKVKPSKAGDVSNFIANILQSNYVNVRKAVYLYGCWKNSEADIPQSLADSGETPLSATPDLAMHTHPVPGVNSDLLPFLPVSLGIRSHFKGTG